MDPALVIKLASSNFSILTMAYLLLRKKRKRKSIPLVNIRQTVHSKNKRISARSLVHQVPFQPSTEYGKKINDNIPNEIPLNHYNRTYGMTAVQFDILHRKIAPLLPRPSSNSFSKPLTTKEQLGMTLRYLVGSDKPGKIASAYSIGMGTLRETVFDVGNAIWRHFQPIMLPVPKEQNFLAIAEQFWKRWHFPNCIGAIGARKFTLYPPPYTGEMSGLNIVLMAVVDATHKFILVDIGEEECFDEDDIFADSNFEQAFDRSLKLPRNTTLPGSDVKLSFAMVGDSIFSLKPYLMTPFASDNLKDAETIFNYRLATCRQVVDNAYGLLISRWKVFQQPIKINNDAARVIVKAAVCLHNFLMEDEMSLPSHQKRYCQDNYVDVLSSEGVLEQGEWHKNITTKTHTKQVESIGTNSLTGPANATRVALAEYFMTTEGQVSWQHQATS